MGTEDVRITEQVRRVLARHWIDPTDLRWTCTKGTLRFRGTFRRLPSPESPPVGEPLLETVSQEIRRLQGVQKVYFTGVQVEERWFPPEIDVEQDDLERQS